MSRYRGDWDDEFDGGGPRERRPDYYAERHGDWARGGYNREAGRDDPRGGYDYGERTGYRGGGGGGRRPEDEYGRERYGRPGEFDRGDYYYYPGRRGPEAPPYERGREYGREHPGRGATRSHLRCRDIMTRDVTVATRDTTLQEVAAMMRDEDTGIIPVVEPAEAAAAPGAEAAVAEAGRRAESARERRAGGGGKLVGLITDRDIVIRALAEGRDALALRAEEIMTTDIHTAQPNDRVIHVIRKMGDKQVRRMPIVDRDGHLRGIISLADVALETEEDRELAEALEEISSGSSFWNRIFG